MLIFLTTFACFKISDSMNARTILFTAITSAWLHAGGVAPGEIRWNNEATDTLNIQRLLHAAATGTDANSRISATAHEFTGTPYVAASLEGYPEMLTINTEGVDCTTFMDLVLAVAKTAGESRQSWHDVAHNLENMRYRKGAVDGYASRLHYISEWVIDNTQRGNIREITADLPGASHEIKTLDFISSHRDNYPALADQNEFDRLKNMEIGYRSHRFPLVKSTRIGKATLAALREGDIVALTTKLPGLDVSHVGFVTMVDGVPHLLHASSAAGSVVVDSRPLTEYLRRAKNVTGIRVFRLRE